MDPNMLQKSGLGMMGFVPGAPQMPLSTGGAKPKTKPTPKKAASKSKAKPKGKKK